MKDLFESKLSGVNGKNIENFHRYNFPRMFCAINIQIKKFHFIKKCNSFLFSAGAGRKQIPQGCFRIYTKYCFAYFRLYFNGSHIETHMTRYSFSISQVHAKPIFTSPNGGKIVASNFSLEIKYRLKWKKVIGKSAV